MRKALAVLPGLALAASLLTAPVAASVPARLKVPVIDWGSCEEQLIGFECAKVPVPLDYDRPQESTITLGLIRKPATDTEHRIGSLFVNPGGPGGSSVDFVFSHGDVLSTDLSGRFDIVGVDPRGIGRSNRLGCFASDSEAKRFFTAPAAKVPYTPAEERAYVTHFRQLGPKCLPQPIAQHMSTADVVRDMDLLRRAVGDPKLNYLGFSYGSLIGHTYAAMFPETVRVLAIDGAVDPTLWTTGWQIADNRISTGKELDELLRLCDEAGPDCAFHKAGQSAKARWEQLANHIKATPATFGQTTVDYRMLVNVAGAAMYSPAMWPEFTQFLNDLATAKPDAELPLWAVPAEDPIADQTFYGTTCADTGFPITTAEYSAVSEWAEAGSRFGRYWWWTTAGCSFWPPNTDRFTGPWRTKASALIVGNRFDGITGYSGAQASARNIEGSRLLTYAGWGHTAYFRDDCARTYVDAYLISGALPPQGTVCPAGPNPFLDKAIDQAAS